ncbi:transcriptional regulator [Vibrio europaeus]|uniref:transcriptional regulator n=1 Tax=Vibrio europaeus TaxID=300876 RepID=UPI00148CB223|nr:transcriptional regulator [Vibrio europaeus]NOH25696.1 helix-turn-helix transcriptional regulator [Vibrio europaeus]
MINKALRLIRQYHSVSIATLSAEFELSREQLIALESGQKPIDKKLLQKYSDKFDIPMSSLIMFSESIKNEGRISKKFRKLMASKVIDIAEWALERHEKKIQT